MAHCKKDSVSKIMLYESIIKLEDHRLGKMVIEGQRRTREKNNWYQQTKEIASKIGITLDKTELMTTEAWKRTVKDKIQEKIELDWNEKQKGKKKTRHQVGQKFERKNYLKEMGIEEASKTMIRRL